MSLECPFCRCKESFVQRTYPNSVFMWKGRLITVIKRRRICRRCNKGRLTVERNEVELTKEDKATPSLPEETEPNPFLE